MLQIYLFGKFCVQREGLIVAGFEARRVQELFSYLLLNRQRPCSREILSSLLWRDSSPAQSKKNLRQVLWQLRSALQAETKPDAWSILNTNENQLQINLKADFWLDVDVFEQIWNKVKSVQGKVLDAPGVQTLRNAIVLHQGVLLEGNYEDWCLNERERQLNICIAMLDKLMEYSEVHREYEAGIAYGMRILDYDRTRESTHRWLMRLYHLLGDRTEALKQYQRCKAILNEDLCAQPDRHTQAFYQQILADQIELASPAETSSMHTHTRIDFLESILRDLKQIQILQTDLLSKVQYNIQIIEQTLRRDLASLEETSQRLDSFAESSRT
jgi:DNA-binding SARP family transcriptional activator